MKTSEALPASPGLADLTPEQRAVLMLRLRQKAARREAREAGLAPVPRDHPLPLSFGQQRMWLVDRWQPGNPAYNLPFAYRISGGLDREALQWAFGEIVRRHEILRTAVVLDGDEPAQEVRPPEPFPLPRVDLTALPEAARLAEAMRLAAEDARAPFDLEQGRPFRAFLLSLAPRDEAIVTVVHHIAADAWSLTIFYRELTALYAARRAGRPSPLPELAIQYADFAVWQRERMKGDLAAQLDPWRRRLAGASPRLELPADRPRPAFPSGRGTRRRFGILPPLLGDLQALARRQGATLFMTLLAAFQALLSRLAGQDDVSVGTPVAGRSREELEGLIGCFINTLVLRADLAGDPPFRALLEQVRETTLAAFAHQDVPFEQVVEAVQPEREPGRTPLFQVMFTFQNEPTADGEVIPGADFDSLPFEAGVAMFDLTLDLKEVRGQLLGGIELSLDLYDETTVERFLGHYLTLLAGVAADPGRPVSELPLLGEAERHALLAEWNAERGERGGRLSRGEAPFVHRRFAEQARRRPEAPAVTGPDGTWTYGELRRRAGSLARHLRGLGVGPDVRVGISAGRTPERVAAVLAVLEAGGVFVPLDPDYPRDRLAYLIEDSRPAVLLAEERLRDRLDRLPQGAGRFVSLDKAWEGWSADRGSGEALDAGLDPDHAAYVIYTSGSTGRPKGVAVTHRGLSRVSEAWVEEYGFGERVRSVLQVAGFSFDVYLGDLARALANGGRLILCPAEAVLDPAALAALIARERPEFADVVPAVLRELVEHLEGTGGKLEFRVLSVGADVWTTEDMERAARLLHPGARLVNSYGVTEGSIDISFLDCSDAGRLHFGRPFGGPVVPIGRPFAGARLVVADPGMRPVPAGVAGELWIGGPNLARGYLDRPDLTAERFVPDPFAGEPGARAYRTGDRVRRLADGVVEFLGRVDHQIKIRGLRVEPGEIEAGLATHPGVARAIVVAAGDGPDRRLAAFVVPADPAAPPDAASLRAALRDRLPEALLPAVFEALDALPLSPNGKVDRGELARRASHLGPAEPGIPTAAPRSPAEEIVAGIFAEVLGGLSRVGVHDDFFDLGGHSLLATQVVARLRSAFAVEVPLRRLFEVPTVAGLAAEVESALGAGAGPGPGAEIRPVPRGDLGRQDLPLSFAQERLWFLEQLLPGIGLYNMPLAVRLAGALDAAALERSLVAVAERHEVLRTAYPSVAGRPVQRIGAFPETELPRVDLGGLPEARREEVARELMAELAGLPFDLSVSRGAPWRSLLLRLAPEDHRLAVVIHHIAADGWSLEVMERDVAQLYAAFTAGGEPRDAIPPLAIQYADYAVWQRERLRGEDALERQLAYWRERLAGLPPALDLPFDRPRPAVPSGRGASRSFVLAGLGAPLRALARRSGATLFMALAAGFQSLLARLTGQGDIALGTPIAGRDRVETERLIGLFVNTLVLRADLSDDPAFQGTLLPRVREAALGAYAHQALPFERVVEELQPERVLSHTPLFQVMLALQNTPPSSGTTVPGMSFEPVGIERKTAAFELGFQVFEAGDTLFGSVEYAVDLFDAPTVERTLGHLAAMLAGVAGVAGVAARPEARVSELPLLSAAERHQIEVEWRETVAPARLPRVPWMHRAFERQAARTPDAVALIAGWGEERRELTFGELDRQASRLARRLRSEGVGRGVRVGTLLERSPELAVAMLAIWKAGGVYVPLDPAWPAERRALLLEDCGVSRVLGAEGIRDIREIRDIRDIEDVRDEEEKEEKEKDDWALAPDDPAYVLFTSGSTGRPKGVVVEHRNFAGFLEAAQERMGWHAGDVMAWSAPVGFDVSLFELWAPLLAGGCCHVLPAGPGADPRAWAEILPHLTRVHAVPGWMRQLLDAGPPCPRLQAVYTGGEAVPVELLAELRQLFPAAELRVLYGPTEATVFSTTWAVPPGEVPARSWIGRPLPGTEIRVLDAKGGPVPVGVVGEIWIGGVGVARGYLDREAETAERFPVLGGRRFYRTGDRGRWQPTGDLEFRGRADDQVKIRGFRIEPGEVEAVVSAAPGVLEAAVVVREDLPGGRGLVAYAALDPEGGAADLRSYLRDRLPSYMIPARIVAVERLPRNSVGKVDRRLLVASPLPPPSDAETAMAPGWRQESLGGPVEELLAGLFAGILEVPRVAPEDSFFDLGGHSLLAARLVSRVREVFRIELPIRALFEKPSAAALAPEIQARLRAAEASRPVPPLVPVPRAGELPLSFGQERLWFLERLQPGTATYNIPLAVVLQGALDPDALAGALAGLVARHETLRTRFAVSDSGNPGQWIDPSPAWFLPRVDLSGLPEAARELEAAALTAGEAARPFDLERDLPLRAALVRLEARRHLALLTLHHIAADAWSVGVLVREVSALYRAAAGRGGEPLPGLPVQYADFAAWQRQWLQGPVLEEQLAYWRHRLAGAPAVLDLPLDRPRPAVQTFRGDHRVQWLGGPELAASLRDLGRRSGATLFMTLLAAFYTWMHRVTGATDLVVGTPSAGRNRAEVEGLIGFFVNSLVLRADLGDLVADPPFLALLTRVRETTLDAYTHQDLPFEKLVAELSPERHLSHTPLFQVMVQLENAPGAALDLGDDLTLAFPPVELRTAKFDLVVNLRDGAEGIWSDWGFNSDLFDGPTVQRAARQLALLLQGAAADPESRLSDLPLLSEAERHQLLVDWNATQAAEEGAGLPELFEARAALTPDAIAVVHRGLRLSYAEMSRASQRAAGALRGLGLGPESLVAVIGERGPELLIALLGIQKAGAAWLPLDPAQPEQRNERIVAGSGAGLLLVLPGADGWLDGRPGGPRALSFAGLMELPALPADTGRRSFPENLAYAIYTSGSTGAPKGALVENRGMLNHLRAKIAGLGLTAADTVAQNASVAFDISVWQLLAALLVGGRVHVVPDEIAHDPARLLELAEREGITVLETVPSLLGGLLDLLEESDRRPALAALRWMIPTGEALPPALARRWLGLYPGIPLLNAYGPTECSDDVSHHVVAEPPPHGATGVPVGRPVRNTHLHVLGGLAAGLPPLPLGAVGELGVSGAGVGRGYRGDPARTAEAFVPDPSGALRDEPGSRLYRTGDLARFLPDGTVDFLGRRDHQVKVRGFRIEIGEVEAALRDLPAVREAAVAVRGEGSARRLVAWVVPRLPEQFPKQIAEAVPADLPVRLRAALSERLPEPMLPSAWVAMAELPRTPNGKLDRRALPDPDTSGLEATPEVTAPRTPLEELIAGLWQEVLGTGRFGVHDSFFDLGGDSIKGAVFLHRLQRRLGEVLYVATLFDAPTVALLAAHLTGHYPEAVARLTGAPEPHRRRAALQRIRDEDVERLRQLIPPLPAAPPELAREGRNPPAVFVLSPPRAGSTLLRVMLGGHPRLFAPPELELLSFHTLAGRRDAFAGRNRFWLEGALRALVQVRGWSPEEARERMAAWEDEGLSTRRFYRLLQEWIGERVLVDKTPSYALDPAVLRQAEAGFEGARYLHLVRHPAASVLSFAEARLDQVFFRHEHPFAPRQLAELIWTVSQENILGFLEGVPPERRHRVVFEDLVREPRPALEAICEFLGIPFHPEMERPYADPAARMTDGLHEVSRMLGDVKFHEHQGIDPEVAGRWRRSGVEAELGAPARRVAWFLGYDLEPAPPEESAAEDWEDVRLAPLRRLGERETAPLSFAQERLWFLQQLDPDGATYNMSQALELSGPLDVAALDRAFAEVVRRHATLRTRFVLRGSQPVPVPEPPRPSSSGVLARVDLSVLGEPAVEEARRLAHEEALHPFDLERGPVVRAVLLRLGPERHALLFTTHHIACDGWSIGLWAREVEALYRAFAAGQGSPASPLPELPVQYADFAAWQRSWLQGSALDAQLAYWRERLRDAPPYLELPLDRPRPAFQTYGGAAASLRLAPELSDRLRSLSGRHNASLFMTLLAAFQLHLKRLSGQDDLVVGSPIAGRTRPEVEGLIGCFLNTLALRTDLSGNPAFLDLLRRVREAALGAFSYQDVPFEKLLEELRPERDTSRPSLFQVLFNMLNAPRAELDLPGLSVGRLGGGETFSKFDLTLYVSEESGLVLDLVYNADLFEPERMREMLRQYRLLLEQIAANPERTLDRYALLTPEAAAVLPDPAASLSHPWPGAVQDLFAAWARRTPEKVALSDCDGDWTYGELDEAVKRLAARLRAEGIRPGDRVAIYAHRSAALAWALLGILKAGAVFTILDPIYPAPRLIDRLNMAEPRGLLHLEGAGPLPPELAAYVEAQGYPCRLVLPAGSRERATAPVAGQPVPDDAAWPEMGPYDVASIAFTSGSTGLPKGIVQTHGSMSYFLSWHQEELGFTAEDRHTMLSGLAHDPLHRDTFYCLGTGATLCVPDPDRIGEPGYLAGWMKAQRVTITNMTPAMGKLLVELPAETARIQTDAWISRPSPLGGGGLGQGGGQEGGGLLEGKGLTSSLTTGPAPLLTSPLPQPPPPRGEGQYLLHDLRVAILAGDLLTREVVAQIRRLAPRTVFLNVYGATESQRALSFHVVEEGRRLKQTLPLGKGKKGSQLLVLSSAGLRAGIGELGEVVIRSPHLAQGYLKDEEQTRAKYGINPFTGEPGDRIYRTGDLGRYLPDGDVEAAGRADQQVKIRGFRVEPGEVEAELLRAPGVKETVVVARNIHDGRDGGTDGERRLVAYLVLDPHAPAEVPDLRERLRQSLPAYMVPSAWVTLEKLPVNPNGKIDRLALPSPEAAAQGPGRKSVPPRDELERRLAEVWEEVLATRPVGVTDDFFDLGGHSLLAVRLMARIEAEMGRTLPLSALFQTGTVEGLAALLRQAEPGEASPLVVLRGGGSRPPLFLVHPLGGQVLAYTELVRRLDPDRSVYGLQDVASPGGGRTVPGLAATYVKQMRSVQPEGPYRLAGWSFGGRIAFAMARQLADQGQEVAFLGLIDTGLVEPPERPDHEDGATLLREILWAVPPELLQDLRPGQEDPLGALLARLREAGQLPEGFEPETARRQFQVLQEHLKIARRDRPQPFPGRLTFLAAEEQPAGAGSDPTHGWAALTAETDLLRIPGDHVSMIYDKAHVAVLAHELEAGLARAENRGLA